MSTGDIQVVVLAGIWVGVFAVLHTLRSIGKVLNAILYEVKVLGANRSDLAEGKGGKDESL